MFKMQTHALILWIPYCGCVLATLLFLYLLWKHHPSYGANPSGPSFPLLGCLPFILLNKHQFYEWVCSLFDRSPSLTVRVNAGHLIRVSTADPQVLHHILKSHFSSYPKGPSFYPFFDDLLGKGIFNCDGALWRFQRKVASHIFTSNSLRDFVVAIADAEISGRLIPVLGCAHQLGDPKNACIDLQALLLHYTFDTICQLTFASDPACLDISKIKNRNALNAGVAASTPAAHVGGHDTSLPTSYARVPDHLIQDFVQGFQAAVRISAERFLIPEFVWKMKRLLKIGSEKKLIDAMEKVHKFTSFVIEQGKRELSSGNNRKDLLARFMRLANDKAESRQLDDIVVVDDTEYGESKQEGMAISESLLKDILLSFIMAGRDTIASGVTFAMWLICVHPRVEREVLKEIRKILEERDAAGECNSVKAATFTYEEVRRMNYMQAVLSESMRLYPPLPGNCKYAARDDVLPGGTAVKKGDQVAYSVIAMGRAARLWGEDCMAFRPERWLDERGEYVAASPFKYPVFQAGPRICLGKDFSFVHMKLVVASLLRHFEFAVPPEFKPKLTYGVNMLMANGLPVTLKKRSKLPM